MTDKTLLDGSVEDVTNGLAGLDGDTIAELLAAEKAGKNRKGVIDALEKAKVSYTSDTDRGAGAATTTTDLTKAAVIGTAAALDHSGEAHIPAASDFSPSGAPRQVTEFDASHPAVDSNPRAGTTTDQNKIDFNDPVKSGEEVVATELGMTTAEEAAQK